MKRLALSVLCVLGFGLNSFACEATAENTATSVADQSVLEQTYAARAEFRAGRNTGGGDLSVPEGQRDVADAQQRGKGVNYLEVHDAVVSKILPDDTQGRPHQKWVVALANGRTLLSVYNSDMGERIPLKVGDTVSMGGQYIWDRSGGLIHWLHHDPKGRRPDGWVELNGVVYGK